MYDGNSKRSMGGSQRDALLGLEEVNSAKLSRGCQKYASSSCIESRAIALQVAGCFGQRGYEEQTASSNASSEEAERAFLVV